MKLKENIKNQIKAGKRYILEGQPGRYTGKAWQIYQRPKHFCFLGEDVYEIISPTGKRMTYTVDKLHNEEFCFEEKSKT